MRTDYDKTLSQYIMEGTTGFRCGIFLPWQELFPSFADIENYFNVSVPEDSAYQWSTASGGIAEDRNSAIMCAIGEAAERYSAALCEYEIRQGKELKGECVLPQKAFSLFSDEQYQDRDFKWRLQDGEEAYYGKVFSLYDNSEVWVPQELISLGPKKGDAAFPSSSTGLAAHTDIETALLSAVQELLERDALTVYWLHALGGREIPLGEKFDKQVAAKQGEAYCFDVTQSWNSYPVVVVCGYLPLRGKKRITMGCSCRKTLELAREKAYAEWIQGCIFSGYYSLYNPDINLKNPEDVTSFDKHAVYYTLNPEGWDEVPIITKKRRYLNGVNRTPLCGGLENLLRSLKEEDIRLYYHELTLPDVREAGLRIVRVISPDLALIHGSEKEMFLGGRTKDVFWRYPDIPADKAEFPNRYPHSLG